MFIKTLLAAFAIFTLLTPIYSYPYGGGGCGCGCGGGYDPYGGYAGVFDGYPGLKVGCTGSYGIPLYPYKIEKPLKPKAGLLLAKLKQKLCAKYCSKGDLGLAAAPIDEVIWWG